MIIEKVNTLEAKIQEPHVANPWIEDSADNVSKPATSGIKAKEGYVEENVEHGVSSNLLLRLILW